MGKPPVGDAEVESHVRKPGRRTIRAARHGEQPLHLRRDDLTISAAAKRPPSVSAVGRVRMSFGSRNWSPCRKNSSLACSSRTPTSTLLNTWPEAGEDAGQPSRAEPASGQDHGPSIDAIGTGLIFAAHVAAKQQVFGFVTQRMEFVNRDERLSASSLKHSIRRLRAA